MTKVLYNGEYIELEDELEPGYKELDLLIGKEDENLSNLEDTIKLKQINLQDTVNFNVLDLEDTQELILGDINE